MPAVYWKHSTKGGTRADVLSKAVHVLKGAGFSSVKKGTEEVSGSRGGVFAFIGSIKKDPPPQPSTLESILNSVGENIDTTTAGVGTQSVIFVAAGSGAKDALADLWAEWKKPSLG